MELTRGIGFLLLVDKPLCQVVILMIWAVMPTISSEPRFFGIPRAIVDAQSLLQHFIRTASPALRGEHHEYEDS